MTTFEITTDSVSSADGTMIGYRTLGSGPGLIIVHGSVSTSQNYLSLAEALADTYTVYIPDRRGRGSSGPAGKDYSIDKECEDLEALMNKTGAQYMFGHSSGGLITLEAALRLPIQKVAAYEPAVSINGSVPTAWYPEFERALAENNPALAMAMVLKGLQVSAKMSKVPTQVLALMMQQEILRSDEGRDMAKLVFTFPLDWALVKGQESTWEKYRNIAVSTLLIGGDSSPSYLLNALHTLAETIPGAKHVEIPGFDHTAPNDERSDRIASELKQFLK
jgi:pimeloyl-ACP methyl ester carboxylesterase